MRKKEPRQAETPTPEAIFRIADDLGISNEHERARLQDWIPGVIYGFHMHERDKVERLTPEQRIHFLSSVEKKLTSFTELWADGRLLSMMTLYERARVLGDETKNLDEKAELTDEAIRIVSDDAQGIVSRVENVLSRVAAMKSALQKHVPAGHPFAVHWLTKQCFYYWRAHLRHQKGAPKRGKPRSLGAGKPGGLQVRFVASIFALAGHELGDATIKTHLNKVRAGRQSGQHDTERGAPVIFDSQLEWRREFYIANVMDLDPNLNRKHGEALWDELLTGTHGFFQDNTQ